MELEDLNIFKTGYIYIYIHFPPTSIWGYPNMLMEELTHWKRLWCWEGLGAGGEGDDRGWDGWMASLTRWTWVWVNSRSWWWTGRPDVLRFMGSQRVGHDWETELNWTEICFYWQNVKTPVLVVFTRINYYCFIW